ncbi:MAG: hypothetical protein JXR68_04785 [Bacteroidales bacterium]|nr:hypothetical protein [Bacteroidales bacterium]
MKTLYSAIIFSLILISISCNEKTSDFENVVEITPSDAQSYNLPDIHFMFSYPTSDNIKIRLANPDLMNLSYAYVDFMVGDYTNEEISIGHCKNCNNYDFDYIEGLLEDLSTDFEYQLPDFNVVFNGVEKFDGENRNVLKFTFNAIDSSMGFVPGKYIGIFVVYLPKSSSNGILFILLANTNETEIKNFDDFSTKGNLAEVFNTFKFVE